MHKKVDPKVTETVIWKQEDENTPAMDNLDKKVRPAEPKGKLIGNGNKRTKSIDIK